MFARLHALQPRAEEASPTYIILSFTNLFIGWPSVKLQVLGLELKMQSPPQCTCLEATALLGSGSRKGVVSWSIDGPVH